MAPWGCDTPLTDAAAKKWVMAASCVAAGWSWVASKSEEPRVPARGALDEYTHSMNEVLRGMEAARCEPVRAALHQRLKEVRVAREGGKTKYGLAAAATRDAQEGTPACLKRAVSTRCGIGGAALREDAFRSR